MSRPALVTVPPPPDSARAPQARSTDGGVHRVLLIDPSLFTAPYDAALGEGLRQVGIEPHWAVRPHRGGESEALPAGQISHAIFYRRADGLSESLRRLRAVAKGVSHLAGLARVLG